MKRRTKAMLALLLLACFMARCERLEREADWDAAHEYYPFRGI